MLLKFCICYLVQVLFGGKCYYIRIVKIKVPNDRGAEIIGELKQKKATKQLLVICHGLKSSAEHPALKAITQKLYEHDHAVFTFNFSDTHGMDLERQVEDIENIVDHFAAEYEEFILIGGSFGALSITIAANRSPKIKGLITVNGFFGSVKLGRQLLPKYLTFRAMTMTSAKAKKFWRFYKGQFSPQKLTLPVLVIHSLADKHVLIGQSRNFFEHLSVPKEFRTLRTSDHNLMPLTETDDIVRMIDEWLDNNLEAFKH